MCYNFTIICKKIFIYYNLGGKELERREAIELLKKYNEEEFHIRHALTVEGVMIILQNRWDMMRIFGD